MMIVQILKVLIRTLIRRVTCSCTANETVLVNTLCKNEFVSLAPGEKIKSESFANDILCERTKLSTFLSYWVISVSNKEKNADFGLYLVIFIFKICIHGLEVT